MLLMYICLYNVVNSMSAVIGCMPMIYQSTETVFPAVTGTCFLGLVQYGAWF